MSNYAIDTASRFGDIPFVEFTQELITGVFDSLVQAHVLQMEEYADFVNSLTTSLSTYINNTVDNVSFDQVTDFILNYDLPAVSDTELTAILGALESPTSATAAPTPNATAPTTTDTWWGGLINAVAPVVTDLVDKIEDPTEVAALNALHKYNEGILTTVPNYNQLKEAIATLIASNKYSLLQNMARQGMMRLVVTEGEIETKITFSTWNTSSSGENVKNRVRDRQKEREGRGLFGRIFKGRDKSKRRTVTVNTAKSYQRDSSGTKVDIFGRVLIKFKTDYAPLNG